MHHCGFKGRSHCLPGIQPGTSNRTIPHCLCGVGCGALGGGGVGDGSKMSGGASELRHDRNQTIHFNIATRAFNMANSASSEDPACCGTTMASLSSVALCGHNHSDCVLMCARVDLYIQVYVHFQCGWFVCVCISLLQCEHV